MNVVRPLGQIPSSDPRYQFGIESINLGIVLEDAHLLGPPVVLEPQTLGHRLVRDAEEAIAQRFHGYSESRVAHLAQVRSIHREGIEGIG